MPTIEKMSIALPKEMASLVRQAVEAGEYSSQSEVVRDALRAWTHKRNERAQAISRLRTLWLEAVADDSDGGDPDQVFDELINKYDEMARITSK